MSIRNKFLKATLILNILGSGLSACTDYTGPDGSRINGPQIKENGVEDRTLTYTVEDFQLRDSTSLDYMRHLAAKAVRQDGSSGRLEVIFLDKTSGRRLLRCEFEAVPDLLAQRKIHLMHSEPQPPREAPE